MHCGFQFQGKRRPGCRYLILWEIYVWGKQSLIQLGRQHGKDSKTIQKQLDTVPLKRKTLAPQALVFIADVTFFSWGDGVLVFRSPKLKQNILWNFVKGENAFMYHEAKTFLETQGFVFQAIVLDGRKGVREVFSGIPVQMCHFHQKAILRRYLTRHPKLEAGQELLVIGRTLTFVSEQDFT